jgi:alpha-beta hydrolase superfamily lysophospholipase
MPVTGYIVPGAAIIILVLLFTVGVSWVFAWFYCKPNRTIPDKSPKDYGLKYESITIPSNGNHLKGWFIPASDTKCPSPVIVLVHSWGGNAAKMLPVAQKLHEMGTAVLLYDARGHGYSDSDGPITLKKYTQYLRSSIDYLESRKDVNLTQIGVVGHSMGAAATIVGTSLDTRIKAAVASSSFADPVGLTKKYLRRLHLPLWPYLPLSKRFIEGWLGMPMDEVAPRKHIKQVKVPVLLFHGKDDTSISPENLEILLKNAPKNLVEGILLPGCGHSGIYNEAGYTARMIPFLEKHLLNNNGSLGRFSPEILPAACGSCP